MPWSNRREQEQGAAEVRPPNPDIARAQELVEAILAPLPPKEGDWTNEDQYRALVAHMVSFHRREAKPEWWAMFNRMEMADAELIEDAECLGGLVLNKKRPPEAVKRSKRYFYKAPAQETKLRTDANAVNIRTGKSLSNLEVDMRSLSVSFTASGDFTPDEVMSVGPGTPIDTKWHRAALEHFATCMQGNMPGHRAVQALLGRQTPRIKGIEPGAPLVNEDAELLPQVIRVVESMDETCLFIQGPPGAGKTYTGSHVIVELLKQGKRVGVTSNSHHAINNLLQASKSARPPRSSHFPG